ncbi:MAG: hypothetical protein JXR51_06695 [Bacteroidales bacterium]|nr:hypothetical protein [Bacteroidales bacterium]MBN2756851.1 hypothetical protein [Bacteroidales bacterium]
MKKIIKKTSVILVLSIILLSSCSSTNKNESKIKLTNNGIELCNHVINTFNSLTKAVNDQNYNSEYINILTDNSPETYIMEYKYDEFNELENIKKSNAFLSLRKVYLAYNLDLDNNFSTNKSNLQSKINNSCNSLDSINLSENNSDRLIRLKKQINSGKYDAGYAVFELTDIYSDLWESESTKWFLFLENNFQEYKSGIKKISNSNFNSFEVAKLLNEPFKNEAVQINLYKLKLIKEKETQKIKIEEEINRISKGFNVIIQIEAEFLKRKQDDLRIKQLNEDFDLIVNN